LHGSEKISNFESFSFGNIFFLVIEIMKEITDIRNLISGHGLKVTPQRVRVLEAVFQLDGHPTADRIIAYVREKDPNIGSGTIYKVLDTFVKQEIIKKVMTDKGVMRYDGVMHNHHHLYCIEKNLIEDYHNEKLDELLTKFFEENAIENFAIEGIQLQISGNFTGKKINH